MGKTMLFGAALGAGWTWLAGLMGINVALSLYYYVRVLEPLYLHRPALGPLGQEPAALRFALIGLALGTLLMGILPEFLVAWVGRAAMLLAASPR